MDSPEQQQLRALLDRYLTPSAQWSESDERTMRSLVREHEDCAQFYNRAVTIHRMMVGAEPGQPSGFEQDRMMQVVLDGSEAKAPQKSWFAAWMPALAGVMTAAAVVLFVVSGPVQDTTTPVAPGKGAVGEEGYMGSRGTSQEQASLSLDISGVLAATDTSSSAPDTEYNPIDDGFFSADLLKFYTSNRTERPVHVMIVGLQDGRSPLWFAPHQAMETDTSLVVSPGALLPVCNPADPLDTDGVLFDAKATPWREGVLTLVAVFTETPLNRADVTTVLSKAKRGSDWRTMLQAELALPDSSIVQEVLLTVRPGSHREAVDEQ